ncbi:hypothetical protein [Nonomuraea sp. NPDC050202]|jgi:hypothetical protein|uniref:hypothetical protein n=1 Tax=Nonomuraea sp. NPDC050202 TaxID=3155035 RepID=UPI0033DC0EDB
MRIAPRKLMGALAATAMALSIGAATQPVSAATTAPDGLGAAYWNTAGPFRSEESCLGERGDYVRYYHVGDCYTSPYPWWYFDFSPRN